MYNYAGKTWTESDIVRLRELITASPGSSRAALSRQVCEAFDWRRPGGQLRDMSCRVAMLKMHREGVIELPAPRNGHQRPGATFTSEASDPEPLLEASIKELGSIELVLVTPGKPLALWNEYIGRYHYLGYKVTLGAQLRYFIMAEGRVLGAMCFGGAAWKIAPRDQFIGWNPKERQSRLHLIVNQTRFLILPWVRVPNLATKSLAMATRRLPADWLARYGYSPVLLETFVDITRYRGICYKAGNWLKVGLTKGRSRMDRHNAKDQPVKSIWLMPLRTNFRAQLYDQSVKPIE